MLKTKERTGNGKGDNAMTVKVTCYRETETYPSAKAAIEHFTEGMWSCDPRSSEYRRYELIVERLQEGQTEVDDEE